MWLGRQAMLLGYYTFKFLEYMNTSVRSTFIAFEIEPELHRNSHTRFETHQKRQCSTGQWTCTTHFSIAPTLENPEVTFPEGKLITDCFVPQIVK